MLTIKQFTNAVTFILDFVGRRPHKLQAREQGCSGVTADRTLKRKVRGARLSSLKLQVYAGL